jgi:hypothetical protein
LDKLVEIQANKSRSPFFAFDLLLRNLSQLTPGCRYILKLVYCLFLEDFIMRPKNGLLKKALVFSAGIAVFQLGLCLAASLPAGTGNLLSDNGFELSEPNGGFPDSGFWKGDFAGYSGAGCTTTSNRSASHGLWQYTGLAGDYWSSAVYQDIPAWPGRIYFASAWVRTAFAGSSWAPGSRAFIKVVFLDASKTTLEQYSSTDVDTDASDWMLLYFATHPAPTHTRFVRFALCLEKPQLVGQTIANFDDCILRQIECADCVRLDEIPPCGSTDLLRGSVVGINPADYKIGVYIFVEDWWPKPTFEHPWTDINSDGSWKCDISTTIYDLNATEVMAFLVPKNEITYWPVDFNSPVGLPALPGEAFRFPGVGAFRPSCFSNKIQFADHDWLVRDSRDRPVNPGLNLFDHNNVWADGNGLHLKITNEQGHWRCAEVFTEDSLGDGIYKFVLDPNSVTLDPNIVLGMFTWDEFAPHYANREMDIEISRWGAVDNNNAQYVIQPSLLHRFNIGPRNVPITHILDWSFDAAAFQSFYGLTLPPAQHDFIDAWSYSGNAVPRPGKENIRINLWLLPGFAPPDENGAEVIVKNFEFVPCSYELLTSALDFNSVLISRKSTKSVRISNGQGCSPYLVSVEVTGPDAAYFIIADKLFQMEPGANKNIEVTFIPDSSRAYEAALEIAGDRGTQSVPLTGNGVRMAYTRLPVIGSPDFLEGVISGVNRLHYRVVSYILVFDKWYIKPLCFSRSSANNPLKPIAANGAWRCDVDVEWTDKAATQVASFLVPKTAHYPPCVLDSLDDPCLAGFDRVWADKPRLGILKITTKAGSGNLDDSIVIDGRYYISAEQLVAANQLCVRILNQEQLIYSLCVPFDTDRFRQYGWFRYDRTGVHVKLQNSGTLLNSYAGNFHLEFSGADLTCLQSPVTLAVELGGFNESASADEAIDPGIINRTNPVPVRFLSGCTDFLRVDKSLFSGGTKSYASSLYVRGAITFESLPPDLTEQDVRLNIGNSTITIPAGSFRRVGKSGLMYRCVNTRIERGAVVNAVFDLQNLSFLIRIRNAKIDTGSEVLVFNLAMGGFSEGVSVKTGR